MPYFIEHIEALLKDWTHNLMKQERDKYTVDYLNTLDDNNEEMITNLPQDLFSLINNQLALLGGQIKGELYIEVLRVIELE